MKNRVFSLILLSLVANQACFGDVTIVNKTGKKILCAIVFDSNVQINPDDYDPNTKKIKEGKGIANNQSQKFSANDAYLISEVVVEGEDLASVIRIVPKGEAAESQIEEMKKMGRKKWVAMQKRLKVEVVGGPSISELFKKLKKDATYKVTRTEEKVKGWFGREKVTPIYIFTEQ